MTCTKWNKKRWRKQRLKMTAKVRVYSLLQFCVAEPQTLEEYSWSWGFVNLQLNELKPQATERHSILPKFKNPIKYDVKHNLCPRLFFFFICRKYLCKSWEGKERARKKEWDMIFYHTEAHFTWQIKKKKNKTLKSATHGVKSMAAHFRCFRPSSAGCARRRSSRSVCAAGSLIAVSCWLGENQPPDCIVFMIAAIWAGFCVGVMRL